MPDVLSALIAFVGEHRRCGDLDGGLEVEVVWLECTCGAGIAHQAGPPAEPLSKDTATTQ
jgi:hypothetical protein